MRKWLNEWLEITLLMIVLILVVTGVVFRLIGGPRHAPEKQQPGPGTMLVRVTGTGQFVLDIPVKSGMQNPKAISNCRLCAAMQNGRELVLAEAARIGRRGNYRDDVCEVLYTPYIVALGP